MLALTMSQKGKINIFTTKSHPHTFRRGPHIHLCHLIILAESEMLEKNENLIFNLCLLTLFKLAEPELRFLSQTETQTIIVDLNSWKLFFQYSTVLVLYDDTRELDVRVSVSF